MKEVGLVSDVEGGRKDGAPGLEEGLWLKSDSSEWGERTLGNGGFL